MMQFRILSLAVCLALSSAEASAQSCPKVTYTTPTATMKSLVASVNCLVGSAEKTKSVHADIPKGAFLVESFAVIGPQHTHSYRKIVLAMVSVPAGNEIKTALVTPEAPEANVAATAGAECKIKLNPDNTVDSQCNLTGGTLYVIYRN
jgi:hypothetical protein